MTTKEALTKQNEQLSSVPQLFEDVIAFHKKMGIQYDGPPRLIPDVPELYFRLQRTNEEMRELVDAFYHRQSDGFLDAHVDLIYILLGTMHLCGYDFNEAWRRVHAANMTKERASKSNPGKYGDKNDVVKSANWVAPNLIDLVTPKKSSQPTGWYQILSI